MPTKSRLSRRTLLFALVAVAACADAPLQPASRPVGAAEPSMIVGSLLGAPTPVMVLQRLQPLPSTITVTKSIGLLGGTLAIPAAGVSIYFPPGAVLKSTPITMSAPAGSAVAYEFGPHGARFVVPPVITQKLSGIAMTGIAPTSLFAAYFGSLSDIDLATGVGLVTELLNLTVAVGGTSVSFPVGHFSGYLIASGKTTEAPTLAPEAQ